MKVVFLSHVYPPFIFGGIGGFVKNLATGLARLGLDVSVVSGFPVLNSAKRFTREIEDGVDIVRFPYPNMPPHSTFFQLANMKKIRQIINEGCPDIIHGQSWSTYPAVLGFRDRPLVVTFHGSPLMERITSTQSILRGGSLADIWTYVLGFHPMDLISKKELQHAKLAVAVSQELRSELLSEFGKKYCDEIRCIYNGVNLVRLDSEYRHAENSVDESENIILFAGRLFWRKGALNLIKLAYLLQKENSKFRIIIHGNGPLLNKMQSEIKSLGLRNVELKGFTTRAQMMKSLRLCKFVVVPSVYDACPMSLLEGMCLGKIPLMLNMPFASELSENGKYGIVANNMESMARKLLALQDNNDLRSFSNNIRTFARNKYDVHETAKSYLQVYRELCH